MSENPLKHTRKAIKELREMVSDAGGVTTSCDYDLSVDAYFESYDKSRMLILSEAFIPERDGYAGIRIMDKERLVNHIKKIKEERLVKAI